MPKVELSRAAWTGVLMILAQYDSEYVLHLHKEISDQVYSQEY